MRIIYYSKQIKWILVHEDHHKFITLGAHVRLKG